MQAATQSSKRAEFERQALVHVDALYGASTKARRTPTARARSLIAALEYAAKRGFALPVRYAVLTGRLGSRTKRPAGGVPNRAAVARDMAIAERIAARLKVPVDCRDAARLAAGWGPMVSQGQALRAAALLDLFAAADALRRPSRFEALLEICESEALSGSTSAGEFAPAAYLRSALNVVRAVDAGAIARGLADRSAAAGRSDRPRAKARKPGAKLKADAVTAAIRASRLAALRAWMRSTQ